MSALRTVWVASAKHGADDDIVVIAAGTTRAAAEIAIRQELRAAYDALSKEADREEASDFEGFLADWDIADPVKITVLTMSEFKHIREEE